MLFEEQEELLCEAHNMLAGLLLKLDTEEEHTSAVIKEAMDKINKVIDFKARLI